MNRVDLPTLGRPTIPSFIVVISPYNKINAEPLYGTVYFIALPLRGAFCKNSRAPHFIVSCRRCLCKPGGNLFPSKPQASSPSPSAPQASSPSPSKPVGFATSPKGRGLGKEMKFAGTAKGSPFGGAGAQRLRGRACFREGEPVPGKNPLSHGLRRASSPERGSFLPSSGQHE